MVECFYTVYPPILYIMGRIGCDACVVSIHISNHGNRDLVGQQLVLSWIAMCLKQESLKALVLKLLENKGEYFACVCKEIKQSMPVHTLFTNFLIHIFSINI